MAEKQILTDDNIERDVKNILENPANLSRFEYRRSIVPVCVFSALLLVAMLVFQKYYKLVLYHSISCGRSYPPEKQYKKGIA